MKNKKRYLCIGIVALSVVLGGCATPIHELTAEEEELIIQYAAYVVAKHNIQQKDGMSGVYMDETVLYPEEDKDTEVDTETETENNTEDTENPSGGDSDSSQEEDTSQVITTLAEIIGHESDLTVSYEGSYTATTCKEGDAYSVDAAQGKIFYIMKFKMTNKTDAAVEVDNAAINPILKLVSGKINLKSEVTFLTNDFSTYQGTIEAGESVDTLLLFEVPASTVDGITEPTLSITVENETKNIKL